MIPMFLLWCCAACGAAGSPIPPEDVGLEAKIREQERQRAREGNLPLEEESIQLPPLRPIGTR